MWVWDHKEPTWRCGCETIKTSLDNVVEDIVEVYICTHFEGCLVTFKCSLFRPCQFWGRLIAIYHTPPFVLSIQKQSISIGSLLCTRIYVTIILMKFTWLFHLCLSWLHDHNVHYDLGQPIHSSPSMLEACTHSFLKHTWGSSCESFPTLMYFWN